MVRLRLDLSNGPTNGPRVCWFQQVFSAQRGCRKETETDGVLNRRWGVFGRGMMDVLALRLIEVYSVDTVAGWMSAPPTSTSSVF